ncbi:MAG: hypothetical protein RIC55_16340 [Pirellulaceae bacterium]
MPALLMKLLIVAQVALLALPVGWCCAGGRATSMWEVSPTKGCCASQAAPQHERSRPSPPAARCCCQRNVLLPATIVKLPQGEVASLDRIFSPAAHLRAISLEGPISFSCDTGPPLHVLQCVWRC